MQNQDSATETKTLECISDFVAQSGNGASKNTNITFCHTNLLNKEVASAIRKNDDKLLKQLLDNDLNPKDSAESGFQALSLAIESNSINCLFLLLDSGVPVNMKHPQTHLTALNRVSHLGKQEWIEHLLNRGADINGRTMLKKTPLHIASGRGHIECITALLNKGADSSLTTKTGLNAYDLAKLRGKDDAEK